MAKIDLIMPKMGESITEATIIKWAKNVGDTVEMDETILEIATDKVDSEIPSPVAGKVIELLYKEDDIVEIGKVIAIIATEGDMTEVKPSPAVEEKLETTTIEIPVKDDVAEVPFVPAVAQPIPGPISSSSLISKDRFYSPLVRSIASKEGISREELDTIPGTGLNDRVNKKDILAYINTRSAPVTSTSTTPTAPPVSSTTSITDSPKSHQPKPITTTPPSSDGNVEIIEMDRMRKLIADHMVMSKQTSPHVTSFIEVDVTDTVNWRNKVKEDFIKKYNQKITFTPIFMDAILKAMKDYPLVNVSVDGNNIHVKKDVNLGMATALPNGNLIVPVIKNANNLNLLGLVKSVNSLATKARNNKLSPDDVQGGTFTVTNVGTFGNVMGTPIINQPQVAILAIGAIRKKPAVLETEYGDVIAIRHLMYLSLSYDHRVVDGFLGGSFLRRIGDYMEAFDKNMEI